MAQTPLMAVLNQFKGKKVEIELVNGTDLTQATLVEVYEDAISVKHISNRVVIIFTHAIATITEAHVS